MDKLLKIEFESDGMRNLLKSAEIADACETEARKMTRLTGVEYEPDIYYGRNRVNAGAREEKK